MSRQTLLAYPYIDELKYKEKIDPQKLNLMLRSIEESVLRAILRGSELSDNLNKLNLGVETSYIALSKHVGTLFSYDALPASGAYASGYDSVVTSGGGAQDRVAGIVTLSWDRDRRYSKVPRYDTDDDGIPDTVSPAVSVSVDGVIRNEEDSCYNMLNRRNDSFWVEQTTAGSHVVQISLPPSISKQFNYIEVVPFPVFGVEISGIAYQDTSSRWNTIYDKTMSPYKFYNNGGPLVMHLSPRETNGVFRITCIVDSNIGVMGFSNIDMALIDYVDDLQTIYMKFENAPSTNINLLSSSLDFYIDNITGTQNARRFIKELSITNDITGAGTTVPIRTISTDDYTFGGESINASNGLYLKIVMNEVNKTSPVIRGCKLSYEV
jgi:hypothetical protein